MSMPPLEQSGVPKFDTKISLGNILVFIGLISGLVASYYATQTTIANHEWRLKSIEEAAKVQWNQNQVISSQIQNLSQDIAIIRDRMERVKDKVEEKLAK